MLYNWDAVQFALALREFDIAKHQPHPPGLSAYVGLGRLVNATIGDPSQAYVALAMLFSAATTFVVYWLARALYGRATALAAAALLAVSPLFWFYGSVGLTYAGEAFGASLVALPRPRRPAGPRGHLYLGALALGLVGGLRLSVLVLLFPLWLAASGRIRRHPRRRAGSASRARVLAAAVLSWFLPLVWLSGGPAAYLAASRQLYASVVLPTSVLGGRPRHHAPPGAVPPGVGGVGPRPPRRSPCSRCRVYVRRRGWRPRSGSCSAGSCPPAVFFALVHFGQAGYVLTFLPALVILLSRALSRRPAAARSGCAGPAGAGPCRGGAGTAAPRQHRLLRQRAAGAPRVRRRAQAGTPGAAARATRLTTGSCRAPRRPPGARGGHPHLRRDHPRRVRSRRHAAPDRARQPRARTRGCATPCTTCPSTTCTSSRVGEVRGFYAPQSASTILLTPGDVIEIPRRVASSSGSWITGIRGCPGPTASSRSSSPTAASSTCCRCDGEPAEHAGYTFVRDAE